MGPRRQLCLLTQITARLETPGGTIHATPYKSSGTSFSKFAVIQIRSDPLKFEVIRRANSAEDKKAADSTEQTAARKAVKKGAATLARKAVSAKSAKKSELELSGASIEVLPTSKKLDRRINHDVTRESTPWSAPARRRFGIRRPVAAVGDGI